MLSILIPVYNFDIRSLVDSLRAELISLDVIYEICCLDDASTNRELSQKNAEINAFMHCSYSVLPENLGRSKTRNNLIDKARYEYLLFLDGDVLPVRPDFIATYLQALKKHAVIYGGLEYPELSSSVSSLHHRYGNNREARPFKERSQMIKTSFSSANFAIQKSCLSTMNFDEGITSYGYEDLVFAKTLLVQNYEIAQIDNPVQHLGIEDDNQRFLEKEHESLHTLKGLVTRQVLDDQDVKLIAVAKRLQTLHLTSLYQFFYRGMKSRFIKNLLSKNPSLFVFDLYRLGHYLGLKN